MVHLQVEGQDPSNTSHITFHHGAAKTPGVSHSITLPVCSTSPGRQRRPYSSRNTRRCFASSTRGLAVAFTSIGSSVRPASMTKSTSSPVAVRVCIDARQMERESCIGPIDFRRFDDAFRAIHCIGRQTYKLIGSLEQIL